MHDMEHFFATAPAYDYILAFYWAPASAPMSSQPSSKMLQLAYYRLQLRGDLFFGDIS